jgi:hypothetical protein
MAEDLGERRLTAIKLQFDALMSEYKLAREETAKKREFQGQLDNLALVALGLSIPFMLAILDRDSSAIGTILLMSVLFFAIGFAQFRHERSLLTRAMYADSVIRPEISALLKQVARDHRPMLEYERFLGQHSWVPSLFLEWIATVARAVISLAAGIGIMLVFLYVRIVVLGSTWMPYEPLLLAVSLLALLGDFAVAFFIARMRYTFLAGRNYYPASKSKDESVTESHE